MFRKIRRYAKDPYYALGEDLIQSHPRWMSDKYFLKVQWKQIMGSKLDLKHPVTFNEKLQWLKIYDHNPLYTSLVDKLAVKKWVAEKVGEQYVIPTIAVYNNVEEIRTNELPMQFVLKCNHDSGGYVICKDLHKFNLESARTYLSQCLGRNFYWEAREWAYKDVVPCLFAEKYIKDDSYDDLVTYKFLCFDGEPKCFYMTVKNNDIWENWYDMDFHKMELTHGFRNEKIEFEKPAAFDEMVEVVRKLACGIPHVRIDMYLSDSHIYFSEYTFYDWGGYMQFQPKEYDSMLGYMISLPQKKH